MLVVDDTPANVHLVSNLMHRDGYDVITAASGAEALEVVRATPPDLIVMDVRMPGLDGLAACRALKQDARTRLIPIVLVTALASEDRLAGIDAGADDFISKPFNPHELRARIRSLIRLKRYTDELDHAESVLLSLAMTIEARDQYTQGHCQRLARYAVALGRAINLDDDDLAALMRGGYLHDLGKVGIPDSVLLKPSRLTEAEYEVMKQHTIIGDRLCGELRSLQRVRPIVRHHHERFDGTGYPDALEGDAIPLLAQVMSVVDVFDALTTARPYKPALPIDQALAELERESDLGWRRHDLVRIFAEITLRTDHT